MAKSPAPAPAPRRALPAAILVLALVGLGLAVELTLLHSRAAAGGPASFCNVSEEVNCDKVAASAWSVFLGVPLSAWGALAYLTVAALALVALSRRGPHPAFPAGLLVTATGLMSALAVVLAIVSKTVIGSLCLLCLGSWIVSFALLALSWRLSREAGGPAAALRGDVAALRSRPAPSAAAGAALALAAAGLLGAYARADAVGAPQPAPGAGSAVPASASVPAALPPAPRAPPGTHVVFEYSDYLCPYCARVHETSKPILASRPDVRVVRRHFPLDQACNALIKRAFHVGSCDLARAAICAEAQGRFDEMDDALFANQAAKAPPRAVAERVGLDMARFDACVLSPATEQRLQADINEGLKISLRGTPSYEWSGRLYPGDLRALIAVIDAQAAAAAAPAPAARP